MGQGRGVHRAGHRDLRRRGWARILGEIGKQTVNGTARAATQTVATEAGTTVLAVDVAGMAGSAAALVLPLAAAAAMIYGANQAIKNARAATEAAQSAVGHRDEARKAAKGYAQVLTGGGGGSDPGSAEAEGQLVSIAATTHGTREMVLATVAKEQGGYDAIYRKNLDRICERMYAEACKAFDESHKEDVGLVEDIGEDWGMRGTFRKTLRIVLFEHRY